MSNNLAKAPRLPAGSAMKATEDCQVHQVDSSRTQRQGTRIRKQTVRYGHETSANNEDDQDLRDDHDATFVPDGPMTTQQKRRVFICNFADASSKEKLCALLRRPAKQPDVSPGFSNGNSKKRKSPSSNALELDEPESDPVTQSTDKPSKKQRRQPAKERAENRATAANVQEFLPEPRGQPEVWADDRQSLCESLPYFQAFRSGAYTSKGWGYGWLLDNDNDVRGHMSDEIFISRFGGGYVFNEKTGKMEREKDQTLSSTTVQAFMNNMREPMPVNIIIGAKNPHCPSKMPHRYNVASSSMVTCIWSEKIDGMNVSRIRLQKIYLQEPSWYAAQDSPLPPAEHDYVTKAACETCTSCDQSWPQVYCAGWMCLNDDCGEHFSIDGEICTDLTYNPVWENERTEWPSRIVPPLPLKPAPLLADSNVPSLEEETSLACWKGMVCPKCGRCNSRTKWDEWKCFNEACDFECAVKHTVFPPTSLVEKHGFEFEGQAISWDTFAAPVTKRETEWPGWWRQSIYDIPGGNVVSHFHANAPINRQPGGANDILEALQGSKLGLERFTMGNASAEGLSLVRHFAINYGMPYKYVVSVNSKGFNEAPPTIINVVNRLTWAGQKVVQDGTYQQFNELLCLGYFEKQSIGYHDDGEKDLGPTIASISIGGEATMTLRMKAKSHFCLDKNLTPETYDPLAAASPGTHLYAERVKLTKLFQQTQTQTQNPNTNTKQNPSAAASAAYHTALTALFAQLSKDKKTKRTAPTILTMQLKHGDVVVMHGHTLQTLYEHSVVPKGKLRYGLTCRYVKPENIPEAERWKGRFAIGAEEDVYDGSVR